MRGRTREEGDNCCWCKKVLYYENRDCIYETFKIAEANSHAFKKYRDRIIVQDKDGVVIFCSEDCRNKFMYEIAKLNMN